MAFTGVDANFITDRLTIRIASIDGIAAETAAKQKRISVMPEDEWQSVLQMNPGARANIADAQNRQRVSELKKQADDYLKNGSIDSAISYYSQVITINAYDSTVFNSRGNAYSRKGDLNQAIADWERALRIDPNLAEAKRNIETAQQQQQREREQLQREQLQRAQAALDQGRKNYDIRDYNRAVSDFTDAILLNPNSNDAYFQRARAYNALRNYDRAIADYTQVLKLDPTDGGAYYNRALVYTDKKDYDRVITDCTQAIRLNSNASSAYYLRGNAYYEKMNYKMAILDYTEAIRLDPKDASAYNNRGAAYEKTGEYGRARADYEEARRLDPNSSLYRDNFVRLRNK